MYFLSFKCALLIVSLKNGREHILSPPITGSRFSQRTQHKGQALADSDKADNGRNDHGQDAKYLREYAIHHIRCNNIRQMCDSATNSTRFANYCGHIVSPFLNYFPCQNRLAKNLYIALPTKYKTNSRQKNIIHDNLSFMPVSLFSNVEISAEYSISVCSVSDSSRGNVSASFPLTVITPG